VRKWFQSLLSKFNLYRYSAEEKRRALAKHSVGLYKLNALLTLSLKAPGFNP
jgi:hypothetical protein